MVMNMIIFLESFITNFVLGRKVKSCDLQIKASFAPTVNDISSHKYTQDAHTGQGESRKQLQVKCSLLFP